MRLLEFLTTVNLFEAARDRYAEMFTNILPMFKEAGLEAMYENRVISEIDWAIQTFKKQDKIVWYLRFVKVELLEELSVELYTKAGEILRDIPAEEKDEYMKSSPQVMLWAKASDAQKKALSQLAKKMGVEERYAAMAAAEATGGNFKRTMQHFMSLGLPAIEDYVFSNQMPRQIISDWTPVEDAWKAKRTGLLDVDREDTETLIEYPDGSEWVNLNRGYCDKESAAMGHCGNAGARENDTILSYRSIVDVDGETMWKPHLTFILDTKTGLLGETKGRGNDKPSEKYHKVIVDLLRLPIIKGIKGGGYMPENNFMLSDLPEDVQDELVEEKPGLASLSYDFKKRGMTKQLLHRMEALWEETEMDFPEFKNDMFWYDTRYSLDEFLESYGGDQAIWVAKVLDGREHLDIWFDSGMSDDLFYSLSDDVKNKVGKWVIENYPDAVEEWKEENDKDYDGTDERDTWSIIEENDIDEVKDALQRAEMTGHEYGAEKEMYEDLANWLKELPNEMNWDLTVYPDTTYEEEYEKEYRKIGMDPQLFIDIIDNYLDDVAYQGGIPELAEIKKLEAPYHGWQGYDEEAAKERAEEELYEADVLESR